MAEAWPIEWFRCRADIDNVRFAKTEGRNIQVGSELWRVPLSLGPISIDHNHWSGSHLTLTSEQAMIISNLPIYLANMRLLKLALNKFMHGAHPGMSPEEMHRLIPSLPRVGWEDMEE